MTSEEMDKQWENIKEELLALNDLKEKMDDGDYVKNYLEWIKETVTKNRILYESKYNEAKKDQELYKKERGKLYWINFGINIGSEFQKYHYAVVLYESKYTALIVPLSSKKEEIQQWKIDDNLIIELGEISDFEEKKPCYALINQLQSVSKKRLDRIGKKPNYKNIKLSPEQMNMIDNAVISALTYTKKTS